MCSASMMQLITYFVLSFLHGGVSDHGLHLRIMDGGAPDPPPPFLPCCIVPIGHHVLAQKVTFEGREVQIHETNSFLRWLFFM